MSTRTKLLKYMVEAGKLLPRKVDTATEKEKAENMAQWDVPLADSPLRAAVRAITDEGTHPLIQPDLLDAITLLSVLKSQGDFSYLSARRLAVELRARYYRPLGPMSCNGQRFNLWTSLAPQDLSDITGKLRERIGAKAAPARSNELSPFEREVLVLRLRRVGLRYFRPREIAVRLGVHPAVIYATSQSIAKKLGLRGLSDVAALHKALMDDPAFS